MIAIATLPLDTVIDKLLHDKAFRVKYCQNPDQALEAFLSPEEIRAIKTGDGLPFERVGQGEAFRRLTETLCGRDPGP